MRLLPGVPASRWAIVVAGAVVLAGCTREPPPQAPDDGAPLFRTQTYIFRCADDYRFSARLSPDTAIVRFGDEEAILPNVVSASGARYAAGEVTFWSKALIALLEAPGIAYADCVGQAVASDAEAEALLAGEGVTGIPLGGVEWRLMSIEGVPATPGNDEALPSLRFDEVEGRITGSTGCNRLMGDYAIDGEGLTLTRLATTRMACAPEPVMDQEQRLLGALERSSQYHIWGDILTLFDADGAALARFTAGAA